MRTWLKDPKLMVAVHGWAALGWLALSLVTTGLAIFFADHPWLLAWVIFMSGYANTAAHWGARQGAESEASDEVSPKLVKAIEKAVAQGMVRGGRSAN